MPKLKDFWGKFKGIVKKVPKKILVMLSIVLVVIVGIVVFVKVSQPYSVLFTGLNNDEVSAIMTYLEQNGASNYRVENNDTILVPKSQENYLKAKLLMEGYPKSGFSYSTYYDHVGSLSTESERNTAYLLSVQDRMGAVIRCFDGVKNAIVNITPGSNNNFVLDASGSKGTEAAVFVTMQSGQLLTNQQAEAIRTFVAHSVQGLTIDSVSISDSAGNVYSATSLGDVNSMDASELKLRLEEQYSNTIRTRVLQVLIPLYGEENVKVGVNCNVNVDRTIVDKTEVILPDWSTNGEGIIGSKVWDKYFVRKNDGAGGGTVGTPDNSDLPNYVEDGSNGDGNNSEWKDSGEIIYDNSRNETHIERVSGYLSDCMVSVSINSNAIDQTLTDWQALSTHVARAAGISDEMVASKVSLYASPFHVNSTNPGVTDPGELNSFQRLLIYAAMAAGALLLLILIVVLLLARRRRRKRKKINVYGQPQDVVFVPQQPETAGVDVMTLQSEKNMELRKDIRKFADDNPEIAAQMLRSMLRGGESDG